ncbi:MAG: response regulator [Chitinivibrionales bacterium]|nr:response regulator [Chitinivibrionales bacterium]
MSTVLLIDDNDYMRSLTAKILFDNGYTVIESKTGKEGLHHSDTQEPDCVMLDLLLSDMDGFTVLEQLRKRRNTIPIIIFSSDIQDSAKNRCFDLGALDFVEKPPHPEKILRVIRMAIGFGQKGQTLMLTDKQNDVLKEMINIGIGKGAEMLNAILDTHIKLDVPFVRILSQKEFHKDVQTNSVDSLAAVNLAFKGDINGNIELVFPTKSAMNLVAALTGENPDDVSLDSIRTGTLSEIGNIVINAIMGNISNLMKFKLSYSVPSYIEGNYEKLSQAIQTGENSIILQARARFIIEALAIIGDIVLFMELDSYDKIFAIIETVENV